MDYWLKCSLCKQKELSMDPQYSRKSQMWQCTFVALLLRGRRLWERGTGPLSGARRERAESQGGISGFVLGGQELREERG